MKNRLVLSLDIGSSSIRSAVYDADAKLVRGTSVSVPHTFQTTIDGGSDMDADECLERVVAAIDGVLAKTESDDGDISCVAMCLFWHSLVGVDSKRKPTTKVFGWADTRSRNYIDVLRKRFDESEAHNRTGAHFHSSFWPAKLLWLRREFPDVFAKTDRWLSFSDYIASRLFDTPVTSISMASGTGIFNIRTCDWDRPLLRFLKIRPENLSAVAQTDSTSFKICRKYAARWPRLKDARWFPPIADGAADNIGSGCVTRERAALMVGTSGAMRVAYKGEPPAKIPDGLWCYRIDRKRVIVGGALSDGGGLYQWLKDNLKLPKNAGDVMRRRGAAAHGLTFLPFLAGERSTGYTESASGAVLGLTSAHDSIDILQAAMESVAYRFAEILDRLNTIVTIKEIVVSGGALRESPVWTQIIADVLGRDLKINGARESSSRGAVLLVLESIGKIENIENFSTLNAVTCAHHPNCHTGYKVGRGLHEKMYHQKNREEQKA